MGLCKRFSEWRDTTAIQLHLNNNILRCFLRLDIVDAMRFSYFHFVAYQNSSNFVAEGH